MKRFKIILSSIFLIAAGMCCTMGGVSDVNMRNVYATINDDATINLGAYNESATQSSTETYSELTSMALYVDGDVGATKALYTVRISNLADIDVGSTTGYSENFNGNSIGIQMLASSDSSMRLPWLSHSFRLSDNLLQASINGYLDVAVNVDSQINTTKDAMKSILYNGTLTGVADITSQAYDMETIYKTDSVTNQTISLSGAKYSDFLLVFAMNRIDGGSFQWRTVKMTVSNPTLSITSTDSSAPVVEFSTNNNWSAQDKILTIKVTDNESGIMSVTSDNDLTFVSETANDKEKVYSLVMSNNGEYSVTVVDNVGNQHTYTYTEAKIDKTKPNNLSIEVPSLSYAPNINIKTAYESDNLSPEKIYYTLDGTIPNQTSNTLNLGDNTLELGYGEYDIKAVIIDEAGLVGGLYENSFRIDRRTLTITSLRCSYKLIKPTTLDTDNGYQFYDGEKLRLDFVPDENCSAKAIRVNGTEFALDQDYYEIVADGDVNIEVIYAYDLMLISCVASYIYNPDIEQVSPEFVLNTSENLDISTMITQNGEVVVPKDVGVYLVKWSYDSYEFVGCGEYEIEIRPLEISIKVLEDQYKIYGEDDPVHYEYQVDGLPASHELILELSREIGEDVGSYAINIANVNLDDNYSIEFESRSFNIRARKLVVVADCLTKIYGEVDPSLTYRIYEGDMIEGDILNGSLVRDDGEDVGSYSIKIGSLSNTNYEILFLNGALEIEPKEVLINIDDIVTIYGENKTLTYSYDGEIDLSQIHGELSRTDGNNVGVYSINVGTLSSDNYKLVIARFGSYTINPKVLTITACNVNKIYGDADNLQYEVDGLCVGDVLNGALSRNAGEEVGVYEINLGTIHNDNYTINFQPGFLTINPAELVVDIMNQTQVYGEVEQDFEYEISGLKFDDNIQLELYREDGEDVGEYVISCKNISNTNYVIAQINKGTYSITKATLVPEFSNNVFVYSGEVNYVNSNFPFELQYIYKQNGIECEGMLNAGTYQVQAIFEGNQNYNSSKSSVVEVVVERQKVYLTLAENKFIYDGTIKFPEFYYDSSCGLDINKISFEFENELRPLEVGEYRFNIVTTDPNYDVATGGTLLIANSFSKVNNNESVLECEEATFDSQAQDVVLVEKAIDGKFNDKEIISSCSFNNVKQDNDHVYTIKIKAASGAENVYVYQLGEDNSVREIAVTNENGYYVFKVDNLTDTYLITKDIEPLPFWFWLVLVGGVAIVLITTLQIIKHVRKVKSVKAANAEMDTYNIN